MLEYDESRWEELIPAPVNTLQLFITNRCNNRCKGCFYAHSLGSDEMKFEDYKKTILKYAHSISKVVLLGGEPTLHKDLCKMIKLNTILGLKTTVYTNGINIKALENIDLANTTIRVGVYGAEISEKPLSKVPATGLPVTVVYMLRKDNVDELMKTALMAEKRFNCQAFYISSIRDIAATHDYWKDTEETLPLEEYFEVVQSFVKNYTGNIKKIHIARRGVIETKKKALLAPRHCRFGNIFPDTSKQKLAGPGKQSFPDSKKIICPLDISKKAYSPELCFRTRKCNKHNECILQKIVLQRKTA